MADPRWYRVLLGAALCGALVWVGWAAYEQLVLLRQPGDFSYHAGNNYFSDSRYRLALAEYDEALATAPEHAGAQRGRAETLIMLGREPEAIAALLAITERSPEVAGYHANLGIAYDRVGSHRKALASYQRSLSLDQEIGSGPSWLTRFLRKQSEKPPGIAERAAYLQQQLALPETKRLLRVPELDAAQRPYKQ